MARYSPYLGQRVEVHYRAGDVHLSAKAKLVADSGKSVFLEEHYDSHGSIKTFRWEIPYQCVTRVREIEPQDELPEEVESRQGDSAPVTSRSSPKSFKDQLEQA